MVPVRGAMSLSCRLFCDGRAWAGLWENWKGAATEERVRTFAVVTTTASELVGDVHIRRPVILPSEGH